MSGTNFHRNREPAARKDCGDMRARIQTGMLINRLQGLVNGDHEMPAHAVTAALGLLRKTMPDMAHTEVVGEAGGPVRFIIERIGAGDPASND